MNSFPESARTRTLHRILLSYRDPNLAKSIVDKIKEYAAQIKDTVRIMNFCGTHEHTITYYGIRSLMPPNIELVAGPGCPVCVTPARIIDAAIKLALEENLTVYTYGDMYKVPGTKLSLAQAKGLGAKVVVVYGFNDAVRMATKNKDDSIFVGVGFETTMPTVASQLYIGKVPNNLAIIPSYRLTPPILKYMLNRGDIRIDGIILPGHVSTIIGVESWLFLEGKVPSVIAGFEPIDVLIAILMIIKQLVKGESRVENEYSRVVRFKGNDKARKLISKVFKVIDADWRGIGLVPNSGATLAEKFMHYDAFQKYDLKITNSVDIKPGCRCADIILGLAKPTDCPLFMKACTPETPYGPCMVSSEGTCHIWAKYGGYTEVKQ